MSNIDFGTTAPEPLVGEVTALRAFRLTDDGLLLPLTEMGGSEPWPTVTASAECHQQQPHLAPDPACTCGFYAYGHPHWVEHQYVYGWSMLVLAAVQCSGRLIAGTKGVRAERMQIVGCFVSRTAPSEVVALLRANCPDVRFYRTRSELLASHPVTALSTYAQPPNGRPDVVQRRRRNAALGKLLALPMFLVGLLLPFMFGVVDLDALVVVLALIPLIGTIWASLAGDSLCELRYGLTRGELARLRQGSDSSWRMQSQRPEVFWRMYIRKFLPVVLTMGLAWVVQVLAPGHFLAWPVAVVALAVMVAAFVMELRTLSPSVAFPLVPRTRAVRAVRESLSDVPSGGSVSREARGVELMLMRHAVVQVFDMGEYAIGMVHFDIVSDADDYPAANGYGVRLANMVRAGLPEGKRGMGWVGLIGADRDRVRVLSHEGRVSPPVPLSEVDAIVPLPTHAWCPAPVRPAYVQTLSTVTLEGPPPHVLPARYTDSTHTVAQQTFSNPLITDALQLARRAAEQGAYRSFKRAQADLPEGMEPVAVPALPQSHGPRTRPEAEELRVIQQALAVLLDAPTDPSTAQSLVFTIVELLDALNALGRGDLCPAIRMEDSRPGPSTRETEERAAHLILRPYLGLRTGERAVLNTFDSMEGRGYLLGTLDAWSPRAVSMVVPVPPSGE